MRDARHCGELTPRVTMCRNLRHLHCVMPCTSLVHTTCYSATHAPLWGIPPDGMGGGRGKV